MQTDIDEVNGAYFAIKSAQTNLVQKLDTSEQARSKLENELNSLNEMIKSLIKQNKQLTAPIKADCVPDSSKNFISAKLFFNKKILHSTF